MCPVPKRSHTANLSAGGRCWALGAGTLPQGLSLSEAQSPRLSHEHEAADGTRLSESTNQCRV